MYNADNSTPSEYHHWLWSSSPPQLWSGIDIKSWLILQMLFHLLQWFDSTNLPLLNLVLAFDIYTLFYSLTSTSGLSNLAFAQSYAISSTSSNLILNSKSLRLLFFFLNFVNIHKENNELSFFWFAYLISIMYAAKFFRLSCKSKIVAKNEPVTSKCIIKQSWTDFSIIIDWVIYAWCLVSVSNYIARNVI